MLTKEAILAAEDRPFETVEVPEWGGTVRVQAMSGTDRDAWEATLIGPDRKPNVANIRARLAVMCIVDEAGNRMFSDADAVALGRKNAGVLDRVAEVARRLNKLTEKELEEAKGN